LLSEKKVWDSNVQFIDTTCPGNTAASSLLTLIIQVLKSPKNIKAVILYVGNCDRITRPYPTNHFTVIGLVIQAIKFHLNLRKTRKYKWNKLLPYEWNDSIDRSLEISGDVKDFGRMLKYIKFICVFLKIKLLVVIPKSNQSFTPGTAKGNFIYYNTIGFESNWKSLDKSTLYDVLNCDSASDLAIQVNNIKSLINLGASDEKIFCAINNYSVNLALRGNLNEAKTLISALVNESSQRVEIFLYNLSKIEYLLGNQELSSKLLDLSVSKDQSSYRIDKIYSEKIKEVLSDSRNIFLIDLHDKLFDEYYLDHCHLLPKGQQLISDFLENELKYVVKNGDVEASTKLDILNPEIVNGDFRDWKTFFGILPHEQNSSSNNQKKIDRLFEDLVDFPHSLSPDMVPDGYKYGNADFGKFPELFASKVFLMFTASELFVRFPEIRHQYEKEISELRYLFNNFDIDWSNKNHQILIISNPEKFGVEVCKKVCLSLIELSRYQNMQNLRLKTIMFWYFRESIMFGFQSDFNSLYERESIRRNIESLYIAYSAIHGKNEDLENKIITLLSISNWFKSEATDLYSFGTTSGGVSDTLNHYVSKVEAILSELAVK
jgi:hypothetical protein